MSGAGEIAGVTGKLRLDDHNRIRRELDWTQIRNGVPAEL
jgi:outer membrane PBP1 activator LpoA protein